MKIASYASGHGLGHATRVSALAAALCSSGHQVILCSSAPESAFDGARARGARYRRVVVDATFVQPTAYTVDRGQTVANLEAFLEDHDQRVAEEAAWLAEEGVELVIVDAPFMPCAAANKAGIPSIIVSNFTFDSCYSYLSVKAEEESSLLLPEAPKSTISAARLHTLVERTIADYSHASVLLRLPGAIPVPAFDRTVSMPPSDWVDTRSLSFTSTIHDLLSQPPQNVVDVPLIVRPMAAGVYSDQRRAELFARLGVPEKQRDSRILLYSFGGHHIVKPASRPPSRPSTPSLAQSPPRVQALPPIELDEDDLLPPGWIAIVCGLAATAADETELPERFYRCPKEAYIPDLTAIADVVLGKLGYGTCSETLAASTPFIYVPRPLFVEEYGLKRLMQAHGTVLELDRAAFEQGRWSERILEAYRAGREAKEAARRGDMRPMGEGAAEESVMRIEDFMRTRAR